MTKTKVIFRVDGGSEIGLGHVSRCCALAEMLKNDFEIYFYTRANSSVILDDIRRYCSDVFTLNDKLSYEEEAGKWISILQGNEIVVLDGYSFNTNYQQQIKNVGCKLVCIDDIHAYHFVSDAVINHAPGIVENLYSTEPYTRLYLGSEYALLKKNFLDEAVVPDKPLNLDNSPVLICLGGADPDNFTRQVLEEVLYLLPKHNMNVVVGAAYVHLKELKQFAETNKCVSLHVNIKPEDMLALMQQSHIAITSASTIALEYICVKGNLFLKLTAENQKNIYNSLIQKQCASPFEMLKEKYLSNENINNQYKLIDGKSGLRFINLFEALLTTDELKFKQAQQDDTDLLFNWINDVEVRQQSLSQHIISYQEHVNWYLKKLADKSCYLYIAYKNNLSVGMIRFDIADCECTISYLVDRSQRGKNIGTEIINRGIEQFIKDSKFKGWVKATVKNINIPSLKIFEKSGFNKKDGVGDITYFKKLCV